MVVDPLAEVAGLGVDARVASLRTPVAPRHDTRQLVPAHHRAARVTLEIDR